MLQELSAATADDDTDAQLPTAERVAAWLPARAANGSIIPQPLADVNAADKGKGGGDGKTAGGKGAAAKGKGALSAEDTQAAEAVVYADASEHIASFTASLPQVSDLDQARVHLAQGLDTPAAALAELQQLLAELRDCTHDKPRYALLQPGDGAARAS